MNRITIILALLIIFPGLLFSQNKEQLNKLNEDGVTSLMQAVMQHNINTTSKLIAAGADVNIKSQDNDKTALHYASFGFAYHNGQQYSIRTDEGIRKAAKLVKMLLEAGADINAVTNDGNTPLIYGVQNENPDVAKILINAKPEINHINNNGANALLMSTHFGPEESARLVLDKGADVNVIDNKGRNALMESLKRHFSLAFIRDIHDKGAEWSQKTKNDALFYYAQYERGGPDVVQYLISLGADVNTQDEMGNTIISNQFSEVDLNQPVLDLLLKAKADVNLKNKKGESALGLVRRCANDSARICSLIKQFIAAGANVNSVNNENMTPLMAVLASNHTDPSPILLLINAGTNLNIKDSEGNTALNKSVEQLGLYPNNPEIVLALVQKTDSVRFTGQYNPLMWACEKGYTPIVREYIKKGCNLNVKLGDRYTDNSSFIINACAGGHADIVKLLIQAKVNVNQISRGHRYTPLIFAAISDSIKVVKLLLASKANLNAKDSYGNMAINYAIKNGNIEIAKLLRPSTDPVQLGKLLYAAVVEPSNEIVKWLIDLKANVNYTYNPKNTYESSAGYTPLIFAVNDGNPERVKMLINAKANVNAKAHDGSTPLNQAKSNGNQEIIEMLVKAGAR